MGNNINIVREGSFDLPIYLVQSTLWVQWDGVYFLAPVLQFGIISCRNLVILGTGGVVVRERPCWCSYPTAQGILYRVEGVGCEGEKLVVDLALHSSVSLSAGWRS